MEPSEDCISAIKGFEGFRALAYQDSKGVWTVGYGWTLGVMRGTRMTESVADGLLRGLLAKIAQHIRFAVKVPLTQKQLDALCDFEYNLGKAALDHSTLLTLLNQGDYHGAAEQFPRWCHAGDAVLLGLLKRRLVEKRWFV